MEGQDQSSKSQSSFHLLCSSCQKAYFIVYYISKHSCYKIMNYNQALARSTQMHIQIGNKEFRITVIYDFAKVIKVDTCI